MVELFQYIPADLNRDIWIIIRGEGWGQEARNISKSIHHHRWSHFASNRVEQEHFKQWGQAREWLRDSITNILLFNWHSLWKPCLWIFWKWVLFNLWFQKKKMKTAVLTGLCDPFTTAVHIMLKHCWVANLKIMSWDHFVRAELISLPQKESVSNVWKHFALIHLRLKAESPHHWLEAVAVSIIC